jgi:hypothetical protein
VPLYQSDMRRFLFASILPLAACNFSAVESNDRQQPSPTAEVPQAIAPQARPVRIGEGGPGFAACQSRGTVGSLDPGTTDTPVRIAPFAEAETVVALSEGATMFVCTRTLDQRWLGVVVPPFDAPDADCGVRARVDRPRDYEGRCASGWIAANTIRLSGS